MGTLTITPHYGTHWSSFSTPTAATACVAQACLDISSWFSPHTNLTVDIDFDFGYCYTNAVSLGAESAYYRTGLSYASYKSAITNATNFPLDAARTAAYTSLPASDPSANFPAGGFQTSEAGAYILGLGGSPGDNTHYVGFGSSETYDYATDGSNPTGHANLYGFTLHEVTECLGRGSGLGWVSPAYTPADLFRFTGNNARSYTDSGSDYCSFNSGATVIRRWGIGAPASADAQDWNNSYPFPRSGSYKSPFNDYESYDAEPIQPEDLQLLSVLGLTLSTTGAAIAYGGGSVPTIISAPTISGTAQRGQTLTCNPASWANTPTSVTRQWKAGGSNVGTNSLTYVPALADVGQAMTVIETAHNASGDSSPSTSAATAPVAAKYIYQMAF